MSDKSGDIDKQVEIENKESDSNSIENKKTDNIIRNLNDVSTGDVITTKVSETLFDSKVIKN